MEMAHTQTLFCRMDYQNGSVWRNEQDEVGRPCGNEGEGSVWKTDGLRTQLGTRDFTAQRDQKPFSSALTSHHVLVFVAE